MIPAHLDKRPRGSAAGAVAVPQHAYRAAGAIQLQLLYPQSFRPRRRPIRDNGDTEATADQYGDRIESVEFEPLLHHQPVAAQVAIDDLPAPLIAVVADEGLAGKDRAQVVERHFLRCNQDQWLAAKRQPAAGFRDAEVRLHDHGSIKLTAGDSLIELD